MDGTSSHCGMDISEIIDNSQEDLQQATLTFGEQRGNPKIYEFAITKYYSITKDKPGSILVVRRVEVR